jgi:hypothetical protein
LLGLLLLVLLLLLLLVMKMVDRGRKILLLSGITW